VVAPPDTECDRGQPQKTSRASRAGIYYYTCFSVRASGQSVQL